MPKHCIGASDRRRRSASLPADVLARNSPVSVRPGAIALTMILLGATSNDQVRVKLVTEALAAAYRAAGDTEHNQARAIDHPAPAALAHHRQKCLHRLYHGDQFRPERGLQLIKGQARQPHVADRDSRRR